MGKSGSTPAFINNRLITELNTGGTSVPISAMVIEITEYRVQPVDRHWQVFHPTSVYLSQNLSEIYAGYYSAT